MLSMAPRRRTTAAGAFTPSAAPAGPALPDFREMEGQEDDGDGQH